MITLADIQAARDKLQTMLTKFLEERGWKYNCGTPIGPYWLWIKEIEGKQFVMTADQACEIEQANAEIEEANG